MKINIQILQLRKVAENQSDSTGIFNFVSDSRELQVSIWLHIIPLLNKSDATSKSPMVVRTPFVAGRDVNNFPTLAYAEKMSVCCHYEKEYYYNALGQVLQSIDKDYHASAFMPIIIPPLLGLYKDAITDQLLRAIEEVWDNPNAPERFTLYLGVEDEDFYGYLDRTFIAVGHGFPNMASN